MDDHYDVVVIGGGPGGYVAAIRAAQYGARVALVEKDALGGTCLNRGCIPTKAMVTAVGLYRRIQAGAELGVRTERVSADLSQMVEYHRKVTEQLRTGVESLLRANKIDVLCGTGTVADRGRVAVETDGKTDEVTASSVILATGSEPAVIGTMKPDGSRILDSTSILSITEVPDRLIVVGAGAIGLEFACIYAGLGSQVTVVEMLPRVLPLEDGELSKRIEGLLKRAGISLHLESTVERVESAAAGTLDVQIAGGGGKTARLSADNILVAVGRRLNTDGVVAPALGLEIENNAVRVDDRMATTVPNLYAVGDITGGWLLAHVASAEGLVAAANAVGRSERMDYTVVPRATWTTPEVASVGMTEDQARDAGHKLRIGKFMFSANGRALVLGETDGFAKIIADESTDEVLGVHIMGPEASELIAEAALAMKLECTAEEIARTIHAHPTLPEVIAESAAAVSALSIHQPPRRNVS